MLAAALAAGRATVDAAVEAAGRAESAGPVPPPGGNRRWTGDRRRRPTGRASGAGAVTR